MINLYGLKYFVDSARLGSMTKAAELNHLSRPAISHAIQKLEQDLDTVLLVHKRRSLELTQAGLKLLDQANPLFNCVDDLKNNLHNKERVLIGEFKIGTSRTLATFALPRIMAALRAKHPKVDFKIQMANSESLVQKLSNREIDLAYFIGDEVLNDYKHYVVGRGSFCLVKPASSNIDDIQIALTERRPETDRLRVLFQRTFSKELPVFAEIQSWDAIWTWVNEGICGGLIPDFMIKSKSSKNYKVIIPKVFPYEIKSMFSTKKEDHPVIKDFLKLN